MGVGVVGRGESCWCACAWSRGYSLVADGPLESNALLALEESLRVDLRLDRLEPREAVRAPDALLQREALLLLLGVRERYMHLVRRRASCSWVVALRARPWLCSWRFSGSLNSISLVLGIHRQSSLCGAGASGFPLSLASLRTRCRIRPLEAWF